MEKKPIAWVWYQEYKQCSCTELQVKKSDLMGYCRRHMNNPRRTVKLPRCAIQDRDLGFVEM